MTKRNCIRIALLAVCLLGGLRALHYVSAQEGHKPGNAHTSANTQAKAAASSNSDAEARAVLTQYAAAVERGDLTAIEKLWSKDEAVTVIENGHANYGWADYRDHHLGPELKEMKNVKYSLTDIKVNLSGHTAWATFKYTIAADLKERHVEGGGLGTAVLQHGAQGWQIVHWHTSSPRRAPAPSPEKKN
ncbi:MAG: nuclear transport factor 2 family protein [Acidobacteria bacterium]|nr:nuclear transport factor 2 family protein [Acidobacteriota bacterium]